MCDTPPVPAARWGVDDDKAGKSQAPDTTATSAVATAEASEQATDTFDATQVTPADTAAQAGQKPTQVNNQEPTDQPTDKLPDWARDKLAKANAETAKTSECDNLRHQLGKSLGLVDDDTRAPDKLVQAITAERARMAQQLNQYRQADAARTAADNHSAQEGELAYANIIVQPALRATSAPEP